jgi:hypothetical protein
MLETLIVAFIAFAFGWLLRSLFDTRSNGR